MNWVVGLLVLAIILAVAVGVIVVVAFTAKGSPRKLSNEQMQQAIEKASRLMNAEGRPPKFLQKLDERD